MINIKSWTGGTNEEYETQHFGFGAQRFKIAVRQMVGEKIRFCIKEMETFLIKSVNVNDERRLALTDSCDKLIRVYYDRAEPCLAAIDEEIERMLRIPDNVLLPEDEVQLEQTSDEDFEKLQEEVRSLKKRVEQSALMVSLLSSEEQELTSVQKVCELAKKDMEVLDDLQRNLEEDGNVKNVVSDLHFLRASVPVSEKSGELEIFAEQGEYTSNKNQVQQYLC